MLSIITATYNRPGLLRDRALASLNEQTVKDFEWIVVNDGNNEQTNQVLIAASTSLKINFRGMNHNGYGLAKARNIGLSMATGDWVAYLDDDNSLYPNYVESMLAFVEQHPELRYVLPIQQRRRVAIKDGIVVKEGRPFASLKENATLSGLVNPDDELFDSNGFMHARDGAPSWDSTLQVYTDYEYLLKCADRWGDGAFGINRESLLAYTQTNEGQIGRSGYADWSRDLSLIWSRRGSYPVLERHGAGSWFPRIIDKYTTKSREGQQIGAFTAAEKK